MKTRLYFAGYLDVDQAPAEGLATETLYLELARHLADAQLGVSDVATVCRECGCTDLDACQDAGGDPCWWAEPDLCSACVPRQATAATPAQLEAQAGRLLPFVSHTPPGRHLATAGFLDGLVHKAANEGKTMLEVGVEGDHFRPHPWEPSCITSGCVRQRP